MAITDAGQDATQTRSLAKTRPIPASPANRRSTRGGARVTDHRPGEVGPPTSVDPGPGGDSARLLRETACTAVDSLDVVRRHTHDVADAFRFGCGPAARAGLASLVQNSRSLLELASAAAMAARLDLAVLCRATHPAADDQLRDALDLIVAAQLTEDWAALAAHLDGPFADAMEAWQRVFEAIAGAASVPDPEGQAA